MSGIVLRRAIVYASTQGTSKGIAENIGQKTGIDVIDIANLKTDDLITYNTLIFVCSTYGRGNPPDSASPFWASLNAIEPGQLDLSTVHFAVCGVGSSNFRRSFVGFAKNLEAKLLALGAKELCPMAISDEAGEKSTDMQSWPTL